MSFDIPRNYWQLVSIDVAFNLNDFVTLGYLGLATYKWVAFEFYHQSHDL